MPPKLPLKSKEIIKRLEKLGFTFRRSTGSHYIYTHPESGKRAVVPYHVREIPKGTVRSIIRESGIDPKEFLQG